MENENTTEIARPKPETDADDDRLSSLPDEIISHILSFLQTKYAVGTAVLSRRWKDLWARVSSLDLDYGLVYNTLDINFLISSLQPDEQLKYRRGELPVPDSFSEIRRRRLLEFCRFVDKVLSQHEDLDSLRRFRFHFSAGWCQRIQGPSDVSFKRELVFGPLVEEIDVGIWGNNEFGMPQCMRSLPQSFYTLKNLTVVKLEGVTLTAAQESVCLPGVRILLLSGVDVEDFTSLNSLISGCPALETAHLQNSFPNYRDEDDILDVSSPSLKSLEIRDYPEFYDNGTSTVIIEAPNLENLCFGAFTNLQVMSGRPFRRLHSVQVDISGCRSWDDSLVGFLARISNADKISLCGKTLSHLSGVTDVRFPDFPNLTQLMIETRGSSLVLHSLLNSASNLQSLIIRMQLENWDGAMSWDRSLEPDTAPECLLSSLEEIVICYFVASEDHMDMLAYLLDAGAVLRKVTIYVVGRYRCDVGGRKVLASLLKLPRRSSSCEVRLLLPFDEEIGIESDDETDIGDD